MSAGCRCVILYFVHFFCHTRSPRCVLLLYYIEFKLEANSSRDLSVFSPLNIRQGNIAEVPMRVSLLLLWLATLTQALDIPQWLDNGWHYIGCRYDSIQLTWSQGLNQGIFECTNCMTINVCRQAAGNYKYFAVVAIK